MEVVVFRVVDHGGVVEECFLFYGAKVGSLSVETTSLDNPAVFATHPSIFLSRKTGRTDLTFYCS